MNKRLQKQYIERFREAFGIGVEKIYEASKIYVEGIDAEPTLKEKFLVEFEGVIPTTAWLEFENIGRGHIHRKLLFGGGRNEKYIKRLGYSDQDKILNGTPLEMLTSTGDTLMVDSRVITTIQADQLFDGDTIRTISEQRAYLESLKTKSVIDTSLAEAVGMPYKFHGGKITFKADTILTKREFKRLFKEFIG